jgi:hypothetical protein
MKVWPKYILSVLMLFPLLSEASSRNELADHPSPYLAMHGHDPVHWQLWNSKVFEQARKSNKLVFVSIGYFSCHWCHVMQRESYRNPEIARFLNEHFIAVKVDRELQPALDSRLIDFVEKTRGYSGWPLNVFITPEGYPLLGIVYLPPDDFRDLLQSLHKAWTKDREGLKNIARNAAASLPRAEASAGPQLEAGIADRYAQALKHQALEHADMLEGGFGDGSKFPMVPQLRFLLTLQAQAPDPALARFLRLTLDKMASQGLRDHLRGGFYRYVVDPNWQTPHFEKMLYDNVLLAGLYLQASKVFDDAAYREVALDTLDFLLREFQLPEGPMIASLSAIDQAGVEGGYYLWSDQELASLLNPGEREVLNLLWNLKQAATLPDGHHAVLAMTVPEVAKKLNRDEQAIKALYASAKMKLRKAQETRVLPKDEKMLASWNGLALEVYSRAARETGDARFAKAANAMHDYILRNFWNGVELKRARAAGRVLGDATLEDYAYVALGMLRWAEYSKQDEAYTIVRKIVDQAWQRFYSEDGWRLSEDLIPGIATREAIVADGPMPSPSAVLLQVSLRLANRAGDAVMKKRVASALNRGHEILATDGFWYATHIGVMKQLQSPREEARKQVNR